MYHAPKECYPIQKPRALAAGQTVGLIAPSGPLPEPDRLPQSIQALESAGYRVKVHESCMTRHGYLAGSDVVRADAVNSMFCDDTIDTILCVRGGYGATRIINNLRYDAIRANPKIFSGYSDVTTLHSAILRHSHLVTFHGLMAVPDFAREGGNDAFSMRSFFRAVTNPVPIGKIKNPAGYPFEPIAPGSACGRLIGGNLSLVASCIGTPYAYCFDGAVLFLEEVNEKIYAVDRMLHQLKNAGVFSRCAAIMLGAFTNCRQDRPETGFTLTQMLTDVLGNLQIPVLSGLQCGHIAQKVTLPFGVQCRVDADACVLEILEGAVR